MIAGEEPSPPAARLIGFHCTEVDHGRAVFEMEAGPGTRTRWARCTAGSCATSRTRRWGIAFASTLEEGQTFTTLELKINFLKPVWNARLRADARVVKRGRTVGMTECDVTDESGSLVAKGVEHVPGAVGREGGRVGRRRASRTALRPA
jgi:uncharacterized protein (TIGR00369 family)